MQTYLLVDLDSDTKKIVDFNYLKNLYIESVRDDLLSNTNDENIVKVDTEILEDLAKGKTVTLNNLREWLESFAYKVIDLTDLIRDLEDVKDYMEHKCYIGAFNEVINLINNEVNK